MFIIGFIPFSFIAIALIVTGLDCFTVKFVTVIAGLKKCD
jgi:hypothetical protein